MDTLETYNNLTLTVEALDAMREAYRDGVEDRLTPSNLDVQLRIDQMVAEWERDHGYWQAQRQRWVAAIALISEAVASGLATAADLVQACADSTRITEIAERVADAAAEYSRAGQDVAK